MSAGTLHCIGMGPGDPELLTLKAARLLAAADVVAYFARRGAAGHACSIAAAHLSPAAEALRFDYPFTTERAAADPVYAEAMHAFYTNAATTLATRLGDGADVALLCEGDPFLYGSAMYLVDRLAGRFTIEVTPGITGMSGCWAQTCLPMTGGDDILTVLPATLAPDRLDAGLAAGDATVIMKIGRNLEKVRAALDRAGLADRAVYVERGTMPGSRSLKLHDMTEPCAPYFSLVLVPGRRGQR